MLFDAFDELNWLAVIVATLAYMALASVWYSDAVMGKQWREATGVQMGEGGRPPTSTLITNLVLWFVAAMVLGLISKSIGAENFGDGLVLGLTVSFGFIGTNRIVTDLYEGRNRAALAKVNAPITLLGFAVMGIILALWD